MVFFNRLSLIDQQNQNRAELIRFTFSNPWFEIQDDCAADSAKFKKMVAKERLYDFLAGLNLEYDPVRIQILEKDPFPTLMQAYSYVQREESRRSAISHSISG